MGFKLSILQATSNKIVIVLKKVIHRKAVQLLLSFKFHDSTIALVRTLPNVKWSKTLRCWYLPFTDVNLRKVKHVLGNKVVFKVDSSVRDSDIKIREILPKKQVLTETHKIFIKGYKKYLYGLRFSDSTVHTYTNFMMDLVNYTGSKAYAEIDNQDITHFVEDVVVSRQYAISTHRQIVSAIKHFKDFVTDSAIDELILKRPTKSVILPTVLSKEEIIDLLSCTRNLKHRAILALIYSAGLRISELINLRLCDIDVDRRQVIVKNSKGRKDRHIILAESFIPLLYNYIQSYMPKVYFAEGKPGKPYGDTSIRAFLKRSCRLAKIKKRVTPHTLRHSYATHLLENGTDIRYIQELLGHARPETTMIYTHVSKKDLLRIVSPLDLALKQVMSDDKMHNKVLLSRNLER